VGQALLPILNAALYYFGKVSRAAMLNFSFSLLRIISMFIIIHWLGDLKLMLVVMGLVSIVHGCFLFYSIPGTVRGFWGYDSSVMRSAIQIARPLTIGSFLERILYNVDGLTISILLSSGMFAFYRAGAIDVPFISSMGLALFSVMMPQIANRFAQGDLLGIVQLKRNAMVGTAFLTYPILIYVAIFHQQIVRFYLTEAYMPSALVFAIYNFTILLKVYDWQDVIVLSGRSRQIMVYTAMALFLNLILAPILTLRIGIEGAALAFVLSLFFLAFVQLKAIAAILETRIVDLIDLLSVFKIILVSLMVALFALFVCRYFDLSDFTAFILFIPYIIVTYWFNRKLGLLPKEIQRFLSSRLPFIFEQ
jgi:O-antigen/teichoic acid export membrane protein